jgi:hypothetical protein
MTLTRASLSVSLLLSLLSQLPATAVTCNTRLFNKPPSWISTVTLNASEILIADPKSNRLLSYNIHTSSTKVVSVPGTISPTAVTRIMDGFLIQDQEKGVVIGPDKQLVASVDLRQTKAAGAGLGSLYSNWVARGATFVGYGSVKKFNLASGSDDSSRGFSLGFIKGQITASAGFSKVELLEATDNNTLYLFGLPYFASNNNGLFFVRMVGQRASIQHVREGTRPELEEVRGFPDAFREIPKLNTPSLGPATTASRFAEIEKSKMAAGLFGQGSMLYLLTRQPAQGGDGTEWWLYQIDPTKPKPQGVVRLPTKASHLSVVPGPTSWYLIERGVVRGWGEQDIKTVVEIPAEWITAPESSPLNIGSLRVTRCANTH